MVFKLTILIKSTAKTICVQDCDINLATAIFLYQMARPPHSSSSARGNNLTIAGETGD
jgi:hypothetical protein